MYFELDIIEEVDDIEGNEDQKERLDDFFRTLNNYTKFANKLKKTKLSPNLTMLLYGPPGTGKTSLTRAYSLKYNIPICVVESNRLVSSLLGDTIKNIRRVIEIAADISKKNGNFILFFDEIDAIGSERSNVHEVGEIKRAVIAFLQTIDLISYKSLPLAIIGATNHQQQLDSAIWRRFTFHLQFDFPNYEIRSKIIKSFIKRIEDAGIAVNDSISDEIDLEYNKIRLIIEGIENSDDKLNNNLIMKEVKNQEINGLITLTDGYSGSDIERGVRVALFKAIGSFPTVENIDYDILYKSLKLVGGTAVHVNRQEILSLSGPSFEKLDEFDDKLALSDFNVEFKNFEELLAQSHKLTPILKEINNILEHREGLKNDYHQRISEEFVNFITTLKDLSKILKDKNIVKD